MEPATDNIAPATTTVETPATATSITTPAVTAPAPDAIETTTTPAQFFFTQERFQGSEEESQASEVSGEESDEESKAPSISEVEVIVAKAPATALTAGSE